MEIRNYRPEDAKEIAELFHGSVHALVGGPYSEAELEAWSPTPVDHAHWRARLATKKPFVAEMEGAIVGFIELEPDGHIDCFYTHRDFQRRGVGRRLYDHLLAAARARGIVRLHVEASEIARPFFEGVGFVLERPQCVERGGESLTNYIMSLSLTEGVRVPDDRTG